MTRLKQLSQSRAFRTILFLLLLLVGVLIRFYALGRVPQGVNQDEAMAGYQAYTLMQSGIDLTGYHNPVYFIAWRDGMNALETYLMMPFIAIFGLTEFAIRLPQAIFGAISLPVFFLLLRRLFDEKTAWIGLFLLVINPWHIMLSRWALESNLAPAFSLFGLYFLSLALDKKPAYLLLSALFFGLCLYTYAITWAILPVMLLLIFLYAFYTKALRFSRQFVGFVAILGLLALPLLLFVAINRGWIPEIRTALFSIPQMPKWRNETISAGNILQFSTYRNLFSLLLTQYDYTDYNAFWQFGMYYLFSLPLIVYGIVSSVRHAFSSLRKRVYDPGMLLLIALLSGLLICLFIDVVNINRANFIGLPMVAFCAVGVRQLMRLKKQVFFRAVVAAYAVSFLAFSGYYFTNGAYKLSKSYDAGTREAIVCANEMTNDTVICRAKDGYIKVLYCLAYPVEDYLDTVVYKDPPEPESFGKFVFEDPGDALEADGDIYIAHLDEAESFLDEGFTVEYFDRMIVAYRPGTVSAD